jgi:hypothetical protein
VRLAVGAFAIKRGRIRTLTIDDREAEVLEVTFIQFGHKESRACSNLGYHLFPQIGLSAREHTGDIDDVPIEDDLRSPNCSAFLSVLDLLCPPATTTS